MADFFISYTRVDRTWAEWIAWRLEEAGYTTILDIWDFRPGANFVLEMQRAATQATCTLAVLSPAYLEALYTQPEWAAAFAQDPLGTHGTLVLVRVQACELHGLLRSIVYLDLVGLDEAHAAEKLLAGVHRGRTKPATPPSFPGSLPRAVPERPHFPGTPLLPGEERNGDESLLQSNDTNQVGSRNTPLARLWTWIVRNKDWVFSGIGTALLVALLGYVLSQSQGGSSGRDTARIPAPERSPLEGQIQEQLLSGVVWDEAREPIPGAKISLQQYDMTDTTDALGRFHFRVKAKQAPVTITVQQSGYQTKEQYATLGNPDVSITLRRRE